MINLIKNFLKKICSFRVLVFLERIRYIILRLIVRTKIFLHLPIKRTPTILEFEIQLAEHCNLNCRACSNFSPIAEPEFVSIDDFERDFTRLGQLFSHECGRIYLLGGEPLLHKDIITLMKIARANFTKGDIYIFTNGILLTKMAADFWEACRDNNIGILISAYPINLPINEIETLANKYSVQFQWAWGQGSKDRDLFVIRPIDLSGKQNVKVNFGICPRSLNCVTLDHGKLFTCSFAPHVRHFNEHFGKNVPITEADYVNIYDDLTPDEILRRLARPIPACGYCSFDTKIIHWGISSKSINEWS